MDYQTICTIESTQSRSLALYKQYEMVRFQFRSSAVEPCNSMNVRRANKIMKRSGRRYTVDAEVSWMRVESRRWILCRWSDWARCWRSLATRMKTSHWSLLDKSADNPPSWSCSGVTPDLLHCRYTVACKLLQPCYADVESLQSSPSDLLRQERRQSSELSESQDAT